MHGSAKNFRRNALSAAVIAAIAGTVQALPQGGEIAAGSGSLTSNGSRLTVQQSSQKLVIDWQSFGIAAGESVRFVQPGSSSIALNRVLGNNASEIYGSLSSTGQIFLTNPNGILFGSTAQVDVGGLVASTLNISNEDFLAGNYVFAGRDGGSVINEGALSAAEGGIIALLAPEVRNEGLIVATAGRVGLGAGTRIRLDLSGGLSLDVEESALEAVIENRSAVRAEGGVIVLSASAQQSLLGGMINNSGVLEAGSARADGGTITLTAGYQSLGGNIAADGADAGGNITVTARNIDQYGTLSVASRLGVGGTVTVTGERLLQASAALVDASGREGGGAIRLALGADTGGVYLSGALQANSSAGSGGDITVTGDDLNLSGATLRADGATAGGNIRIGGDFQGSNADLPNARTTFVNSTTLISADALQEGDGGRVIVWSDQETTFAGSISARAGLQGGDGGFVEVSGKDSLGFAGSVDVQAPLGENGTLLLDPKNITVSTTGTAFTFRLTDPSPSAGNEFGDTVLKLSGGNLVVTSPLDDFAASNSGAAYLFNPATGALISTLRGSLTDSRVGLGGVVALTNGNYVVVSPEWDNPVTAGFNVGAVTWGNGSTGISGTVSSSNSLVGTHDVDYVGGDGVFALSNGNYVVASSQWHVGASSNVGAVTWGNGSTGITGAVTSSNSLVGTSADDYLGNGGVVALSNGNYVVVSPEWDNLNAAAFNAGAVTWGNGSTGITGAVSSSNSLVGTHTVDYVGGDGVFALSNGNYVVASSQWLNNSGAATWGNGDSGTTGAVTSSNSLVGAVDNYVGNGGVVALSNGNYVVVSPEWDNLNAAAFNAGAVTWGNGSTGITGAVSSSNSLVGSVNGDSIGLNGVYALSNGNYVVASSSWDNGGVVDAGAVTLGNGAGGISGAVTSSNSLVGNSDSNYVGKGGVVALTNGNYVVVSPKWDNAATAALDVGAVTWGDGSAGLTGAVSTGNSLVGTLTGDNVGGKGVYALGNGNYVVASPSWGEPTNFGAVTWGSGTTGIVGAVNSGNSLLGTVTEDRTGNGGVTTLAGGGFVVRSTTSSTGLSRLDLSYSGGTSYAQGGNVNLAIHPDALLQTLNLGTNIVLQASNDITVSSALIVNNPAGNGGALTLAAGRSVLVNAGITTDNGNLTLIANDLLANGVVNAQRDAGAANIQINAPLNVGSGTLTVDLRAGTGLTNNTKGQITTGASGSISTGVFNLVGGDWRQIGASLPAFSATDFRLSGGTFVRALAGDGSAGSPYQVTDMYGLQGIGTLPALRYLLVTDLDATASWGWNGGGGFAAIQNFSGGFDGLNYVISNLHVSGNNQVGLFGRLQASATVRNLDIVNADIQSTGIYQGILAGLSYGTVDNVYVSGSVNGTSGSSGGLIGMNYGTVSNTGASAFVSGGSSIGGLVGWNYAGLIEKSFATGTATGGTETGGLVGINNNGGIVRNTYATGAVVTACCKAGGLIGLNDGASVTYSYATGAVTTNGFGYIGGLIGLNYFADMATNAWNTQTSGVAVGVGGTGGGNGFTTVQMQQLATFTNLGWSIDAAGGTGSIWRLYEGQTAPLLRDFLTPLTVTANNAGMVYSGSAYSGGNGFSYSTVPNLALLQSSGYTGSSQGAIDVGNYVIAPNLSSTQLGYDITLVNGTLSITPKALDLTGLVVNEKVYDGTTSATVNSAGVGFSGLVAGDVVTLNLAGLSASFLDKSAGLDKSVSLSGLALDGADAGNYTLNGAGGFTADITPLTISATGITASNKVYDGTNGATLLTGGAALAGVLGGEAVSLDLASVLGTFSDRNVGNGKTVAVSGLTLSGADAGNYLLAGYSMTANITPLAINATDIGAGDKLYDATTAATLDLSLAGLAGVLGSDGVSLATGSASGSFSDKNVATGKTVTVNGLTLSGVDAGNYALNGYTTTASITPFTISATGISASDKVYDATTSAALNAVGAALSGVFGSDAVTLLTGSASAAFADKDVAAGQTVTVSGLSLNGADSGNYLLAGYSTTASITPLAIEVIGITASNKVYDATTAATLNTTGAGLSGVLGDDVLSLVTASASGTFAEKNVANGKTVTVSSLALSGADAGNYVLAEYSTTANITPLAISATGITAADKVYDATTAATLNTASAALSGLLGGDVLSLLTGSASGTFSDKIVANGKAVTVSGLALSGAEAGNYILNAYSTTASITPLAISATGIAAVDKAYDTTTTAMLDTTAAALAGVLGSDVVGVDSSAVAGSFADANAGSGKTVTVSGLALSGSDAGNYTLDGYSTTASISPAPLVVTVANASMVQGQALPTFSYMLSGLLGSDSSSVVSGIGYSTSAGVSPAPGNYAISASGGSAQNYLLSYVDGALVVTALPVVPGGGGSGTAGGDVGPGYEHSGLDVGQQQLPPGLVIALAHGGLRNPHLVIDECGIRLPARLGKDDDDCN